MIDCLEDLNKKYPVAPINMGISELILEDNELWDEE
jgi:hypothetical protein